MSVSLAMTTATETLTTYKCCLCKPSNFAGKFEQLVWTIGCVCICNRDHFLLFNNNALKKCANGKAFYIVASR